MVAITAILREITDVSLQRRMLNIEEPNVPANATEESFVPIEANDVKEYKTKEDDSKNDKLVVTSAWDKVFESSQQDIRVLFLEAIEDFYSVTGGPSSYEEKMVVLLEMYLKKNRRLSWNEKLNAREIRKFVFKNIKELSSPPIVVDQNKNVKYSLRVFLTNAWGDCCVNLRRKFKSKVRSNENDKSALEVIDVRPAPEGKIRCLPVRKFFSRLNCFKSKSK